MKLNRIALIPALLALLFAACNKKNDTPYKVTITGVNLRTIDAAPAGILGAPDVHTEDDRFFFSPYPIPTLDVLAVYLRNTKADTHVRLRLISVIYEDAPATAIVQNTPIAGSCLIDQSIALPVTGPGSGTSLQLDVSKLPRGFYRLYAETDDGSLYWDNIWLMR